MTETDSCPADGYPTDAYAPDGTTLWWELDVWPNMPTRKFGAERKIAAWLAFNVGVGETFTMPELRDAIGDGVPNTDEHLNRRLRRLRPDGWDLLTTKDDASLPSGVYRVDSRGWSPADGDRPRGNQIPDDVRRRVLDRDHRRCVVCGVGSNENYPNESGATASLTVGHRIPGSQGGSSRDANNLQAECKRCNEPVRDALRSPETLSELRPDVVNMRSVDAKKLNSWLTAGQRLRDRVDAVYDRARFLSSGELEELKVIVSRKAGGA